MLGAKDSRFMDTLTRVGEYDIEGVYYQDRSKNYQRRLDGGALKVIAPADPRAAIARLCAEKGYTLTALERVLPTLEDAFLSLVGAEA